MEWFLNCHITSFKKINFWSLGKQGAERASKIRVLKSGVALNDFQGNWELAFTTDLIF